MPRGIWATTIGIARATPGRSAVLATGPSCLTARPERDRRRHILESHREECEVDGCDKPRRTASARWCKKHYMRWYRHGDPLASFASVRTGLGRRYVSRHDPSHPIAPPCGRIWVHRVVLYDEIGDGVHLCHWCGAALEWRPSSTETKPLTVDHLNGDGADNRIENLVPSCNDCNSGRATRARAQVVRRAGAWSGVDGDREAERRARRAAAAA